MSEIVIHMGSAVIGGIIGLFVGTVVFLVTLGLCKSAGKADNVTRGIELILVRALC